LPKNKTRYQNIPSRYPRNDRFAPEAAVLVRAAKPVASVDGYEIRFVGSDRYRLQYKIVEDRSFSPEKVGRRSRGATRTIQFYSNW